jgi:methionyl-tRNA formyltransferase
VPLKVLFCGTPAFGLPTLELLLEQSDFSVAAVLTQPDRPKGRGQGTGQSPIKQAALKARVPIHQPEKLRTQEAVELISQIRPDVSVVIAYGQIIPRNMLEIPRLGWINLHGSLLPKYRGAAPVQRAILAGERRSGLTVMRIDAGLDTGPILAQTEIQIGPDETAAQLLMRMSELGAPLMIDTLRKLERGEITPKAQSDAEATLAPPLKKEEGLIDWRESVDAIYNRIRAFDPWPGAYTRFRGSVCHVWGKPGTLPSEPDGAECGAIVQAEKRLLVACGSQTWLEIDFLRAEGRKRLTAAEFANGARLTGNDRFTS